MAETDWTYDMYIPDDDTKYRGWMKRQYLVQNDYRTLGAKKKFDIVSGVVDTNTTTTQTKGRTDGTSRSVTLEAVLSRVAKDHEKKYQEVQADKGTLGVRAAIDKALGISPPRTNDDPPTVDLIDLSKVIGTVTVNGEIEDLDIALAVGL